VPLHTFNKMYPFQLFRPAIIWRSTGADARA